MSEFQRNPFRVAIVGGGPRGLFALESLVLEYSLVPEDRRRNLEVTMFEPCPFPGAGNVYDPRQPDYLLMNFTVEHINLWSEKRRRFFPGAYPNLEEWINRTSEEPVGRDEFVPRPLVGKYLYEGFCLLQESFPRGMKFRLVPEQVMDIQKNASCWSLTSNSLSRNFDSVAVATGHGGWRPAGSDEARSVFPVEKNLTEEIIPRHTKVKVRGFALTWIDATLALTEGRGGSFLQNDRGFYNYSPSGREPARIIPFSRTGRPMFPKPDRAVFPASSQVEGKLRKYRVAFQNLPSRVDFKRDIRPLIFSAADELIDQSAEDWFESWTSGKELNLVSTLSNSCKIATGTLPPDQSFALAEVWRKLYEPIVRAIEHGQMTPASWSDYETFCRELERIAFGPPVQNVQKMLALHDAGILSLDEITSEPKSFDHTIDARIPSPLQLAPRSPLRILESEGRIRRLHDRTGFEVDRAGRAITSGGSCLDDLALFGRVTEGCVIGNDTLSRTLNQHIDRWANLLVPKLTTHDNYQLTAS